MNPRSFALVLCLFSCLAATETIPGGPGWTSPWAKGAEAPGYAKASAHEPRFDDRALWPLLQDDEPFTKQAWPKGRLVVWAKPGTSGDKAGLDPWDAANWLVDGQPGTGDAEALMGPETDLLFPASDKPYTVQIREAHHGHASFKNQVWRHITVERGATFRGGADAIGRKVAGNVWVKKGGSLYGQGSMTFIGSAHSFVRNDNAATSKEGVMISQYFSFSRGQEGSVEYLGHVTCLDEFKVLGSAVVVGRDSLLQPGRHAGPFIEKGGSLSILDGGAWGKWTDDFDQPCLAVRDGIVQGGTAERPLKRHAWLLLGHKNHGAVPLKSGKDTIPRTPGLVLLAGVLRSHSADPAKACLVVSSLHAQGNRNVTRGLVPPDEAKLKDELTKKNPEMVKLWADFAKLPDGIDLFLGQGVTVENVRFDDLRAGGLLLPDPAVAQTWKGVSYGPLCKAQGPGLVSAVGKLGKNSSY